MQNSAGETNPYRTPAETTDDLSAPPTKIRFIVVGLCITMAVLLYVHRFALTPVSEQVRLDFEIDEEQFGRVVSAFFFSYALLQVPGGWLSDLFGARVTLTVMVAVWSVAFMSMGFVHGLTGLILLRILFGVMQAGAYPTAAACIKRWVPLQSRGKASAAVSMGGRCGGLIAFGITPLLVGWSQAYSGTETGSWRPVFIFYGSLGLVWCFFFYWLFRNTPKQHPWCNAAECDEIEGPFDSAAPTRTSSAPGDAVPMVFNPMGLANVVLLAAINLLVNIAWIFLATWMTSFLTKQLPKEVSVFGTLYSGKALAGVLTAIPAVGGLIGSLMGGFMTDYFLKRNGKVWGRRVPGIIACVLAGSLYLVCAETTNLWLLIPLFFAISLTIDLGLGATWTTVQDIGGKNVGLVLGICNMCGNLGAAVFSYVIGPYAKAGDWSTVFYISTTSLVLTLLCWLVIDPSKPIREPLHPSR